MIKLKSLLSEISAEDARTYLATTPDQQHRYDIEEHVVQIAAAVGETLTSSKPIGEGTYGSVYSLASGKILKLTVDTDEVATAAHFRTRRKTPHIMSYYDVRPVIPRTGYNQFFAIIMDRITPLNESQKNAWRRIQSEYFDTGYPDAWFMKHFPNSQFVKQILPQRRDVLRAVQSFNVYTYEAHEGNIGFDKQGRFTVYDMWSDRSNTTAVSITSFRKMLKPIDLTPYLQTAQPDSTGIDTPNNPDM